MDTLELIFLLAHLISTGQLLHEHTFQLPMTIFVKVFFGSSEIGIHHCILSFRKCSQAWLRLPSYLKVQRTCHDWFMKFNENLLARMVWCLRTHFLKCWSGSIQQIPIKFLSCESHYSGGSGVQAEFPIQKQIFSIMPWRVLYISKLAGDRGLKLFQTVVGSKLLSVLITLSVWCSSFSQQLTHCSLSVID